MKKNRFRTGGNPKLKNLVFSTLLIFALFTLLSLLITVVCYSGENPTANITLLSMAALIASGGIGSFVNMKLFYDGEFHSPLIAALISAAVYLVISLIASGRLAIPSLINVACFILISLLFHGR